MFRSKITVNLPSVETRRTKGPIEWVRSLFGAEIDLRSGKEALTIGTFSLLEGIVRAFQRAGVTNAISLLVDKKVVYMDANDVPDDLLLIGKAAEAAGIFDRTFREMHLVLTHHEAGLHSIVDVGVVSEVMLGEEEMWVDFSSRVESLRVRPGEEAQAYAERVKRFAGDPQALDVYRHALQSLTERVADALRTSVPGAKVSVHKAGIELVRPEAKQIGRFRNLGWGEDAEPPEYRPIPTMQRSGAYADPYYYYYHDPYYDFMNWVLISNLMWQPSWHHWHHDHVYVVNPAGDPLYGGTDVLSHASDPWVGSNAVSFGQDGDLQVSQDVPFSSGTDAAFSDATTVTDFGGGDDAGGSSSCSSGASCTGGSSCGSSCSSGSSCGSSCSSGSSCGSSCGGGSD